MGSDDLHHKRKAKKEISRKKASCAPYEKVLIVCEGGKTEPIYFEEIRDYHEISLANVEVTGECGSDPMSVVHHAIKLYGAELDKNPEEGFDRVYCVFDRDSYHQQGRKYQEALAKLKQLRAKKFYAINSVPCFEYWFILHFDRTTKSYSNRGSKSVAGVVLSELMSHWPQYEKAMEGTYQYLLKQQEQAKRTNKKSAKENAEYALAEAAATGASDPITHVHELVDYLENIKKFPKDKY